MKNITIRALTLALALAATGTAMAQNHQDGRMDMHSGQNMGEHRGDYRPDPRADHRDYRAERRDERRAEWREDRREERFDRAQARHEYRRFHKGERMPVEYRNRQYVVQDWRAHHLTAPRHGYQWVQTGSDYALVAITTGLILQVLTH